MKKFIASIIVTLATVLTFNSAANATWTYYDYSDCIYVESWYLGELPENDTDGIEGPNDVDRIQTIGEDLTIFNRIDYTSKYNIISLSIPTYFYGLANQTSVTRMYVTIISEHTSDPSQDYYFHSNAITILPDQIGGDTKFYTIGAVVQEYPSGAQQAPMPVAHRTFTVIIEIVGPQGVQHLVDQVRVNSTANYAQADLNCVVPH